MTIVKTRGVRSLLEHSIGEHMPPAGVLVQVEAEVDFHSVRALSVDLAVVDLAHRVLRLEVGNQLGER